MARIAAFVAGASIFSFACGAEPPSPEVEMLPLEVAAIPPGSTFEGSTSVSLEASRPAQIFYTLDGQDPLGEHGRLYTEPLELAESTLVTFIAVGDDGVFSVPATELYSPTVELIPPDPIPRALTVDRDSYFFVVHSGEQGPFTTTFSVRSTGFEPVHISEAFIAAGNHGFFEDGIFTMTPVSDLDLAPGQTLDITVRYQPTQTLRGGALVIRSNDMRHEDGLIVIELWGRVFAW